MSPSRINVLVYSGNGSTVEAVRHCLYTLRRLLSPNYAVIPVTGDQILKEPWTANCAALVFPGGADKGYCRTLDGNGNRRIRQYVEQGGIYIGFCAGGYYGTKRCEFEVGDKVMEVVGERELGFFPGIARGCAFSGFVYNSERGARAAELSANKQYLSTGSIPNIFKSYYNGGSVFVDAPKFAHQGVEVLASYTEELSINPGEGQAAVVYCKVGKGAALLTGPHPEFVFLVRPTDNWSLTKPRFSANILKSQPDVPGYSEVVKQLKDDEHHRMDFLKACLTKLGLQVSEEQIVPSLSRMHISSLIPARTSQILADLQQLIKKDPDHDGEEMLKDENDTFHIVRPSVWNMLELGEALPTEGLTVEGKEAVADKKNVSVSDQFLDYNSIIKQLLFHDEDYPDARTTPYFNHDIYYTSLKRLQSMSSLSDLTFGNNLLYGEVVTSTNTLLEKNINLLSKLPQGFTATATTQVAGRGRGNNVWVSPPGNLMFSTVVYHPMSYMATAPVVFLQYLAAMAVVEGIKNYIPPTTNSAVTSDSTTTSMASKPYANMPIKLKWPNDIYALDPAKYLETGSTDVSNYVKIGGILVNSHYNAKDYIAVVGIGLNVSNTATPTTSLNQLIPILPLLASSSTSTSPSATSTPAYTSTTSTGTGTGTNTITNSNAVNDKPPPPPPPIQLEPLLATILTKFESLHQEFTTSGFSPTLSTQYHKMWLHTNQIVTLENHENTRARIRGISSDWGMLIVDELGYEDRETGRKWELVSDSNSFDFLRGLVRSKVL